MGMYTELFVEGTLKAGTPPDVVAIIDFLFGNGDRIDGVPSAWPDHEFFQCSRWTMLGVSNSFYHVPMSLSGVHTPHTGQLSFVSRSDLKNYDGEIEKFIDWVRPYCELLRGWHMYEEDHTPTVFTHEEFGD